MAVAGVMITRLLDALEKEGKRILAECEQERTYTHRTQNLYDSYGYGVYYNGKLQEKAFSVLLKPPRKPKIGMVWKYREGSR